MNTGCCEQGLVVSAMQSPLVSFPITVTKYPYKNNIRKKAFILPPMALQYLHHIVKFQVYGA